MNTDLRGALMGLKASPVQVMPGIVLSVDEENSVCTVALIEDEAIVLEGVRLKASEDDTKNGFILHPATNSTVLISKIFNENDYFISMLSDVAKVVLQMDGQPKITVVSDQITLDEGAFGGLVKVEVLAQKLNNLEQFINAQLALLKTHVHSANNTPSVAFNTLNNVEISNADELQNEKVRH